MRIVAAAIVGARSLAHDQSIRTAEGCILTPRHWRDDARPRAVTRDAHAVNLATTGTIASAALRGD